MTGVRIWWLRRRFELVVLASVFLPYSDRLYGLGERLLLAEIDLEKTRDARRRLR